MTFQTRNALMLAMAACVLALTTPLFAQTIVVTIGDDTVDFAGAQTVANLPGPDGVISLREAVTAANNTPGPQEIQFAIPRATWWNLFPNQAGCRIDNAIFLTDPGTTIDFTTQTALTGDTNPGAWEVAVFYAGATTFVSPFMVLTDNCTIKGLDYVGGNSTGPSVRLYGNNNRIVAATRGIASVALDPTIPTPNGGNVIGGTAPEDRNDLKLVWFVHGASGNTVIGNTIRSVKITGDTFSGPCSNNRIGGPTPQERNTISGNGGSGEEGFPTGIQVEIKQAVGTIIEGNYIGTTTDGMSAWPGSNGTVGVSVGLGASGTIVRNNLISGIARTGTFRCAGLRFGTAIEVADGSASTRIVGNRIGPNADATGTITNVQGLLVARPTTLAAAITGVTIGGAALGEGNIITGSELVGITIHSSVAGVRLSRNSIYNNGTLAIDLLGSVGVTPNDSGDTDVGGNNLQNFPVLAAAYLAEHSLSIRGSLDSVPLQAFELEFFASPSCDATGHGEGEHFLGTADITTNAAGHADFVVGVASAGVTSEMVITATATRRSTGDTSEFSACRSATLRCATDLDNGTGSGTPDGAVDINDLLYFLVQFEAGSVVADLDDGTGTGTPDTAVDVNDLVYFLVRFEIGC